MNGNDNHKLSRLRASALLAGASIALYAGFAQHAAAQTTQQFTGHITDASGAVIPEANVIIHNEDTGVDSSTTTTRQGVYTVPYLKPGIYDITVTKQGFKTEQKTAIALATDQTSTIDFHMAIGTAQELVTVNASGVQVELSKSDRGELIEAERVQQLPIDSRNAFNLVALSPGVHDFSSTQYGRQFDNVTGNQYVNGSPQVSQTSLDGVGNDVGDVGRTAYTPSVDAVQEFKVVLNAYDASYGHSGGSAVDVTLKSGTNKLHGAVDWFGRRTWLDAGQWQNLYNGTFPARPTHKRDQENYELDGPVVIPHLVNGRDKLFFFGNYEQLHDLQPNPSYSTYSIPDPAWLTGDFSNAQYFNTTTNSLQPLIIYDPLSPLVSVVDPRDGKAKLAHSPFPGNQVPQSRLDPTAAKIAAFYNQVSPNVNPGPGFAPYTSNYQNLQIENDLFRNAIFKIDWVLSNADKFSFRWGAQARTISANANTGFANSNLANQNAHGAQPSSETGSIQWTHIFSPRLVFNFNSSVMTYGNNYLQGPRSPGLVSALGFSNAYVNQIGNTDAFPAINASSIDSQSASFAQLGTGYLGYSGDTHAINVLPTVTYVRGAHTMRAGMNLNFDQWDNPKGGNPDTYSFTNNFTQQFYNSPDAPGYDSGSSIASLVLGYPNSGNVTWNTHQFFSQRYFAPWFQDDWKISQRLTLNLGVRWDLQTPRVERFNKLNGTFDPTVLNPVSSQIPTGTAALGSATQVQGGLTFAGVNGQPRGAYNLNKMDVQPRIGFAYAISPRMSLRGGVGENFIKDESNNNSDGFGSTTNYTSSLDNGITPYTATTGAGFSNPIPSVQVPTGSSKGYFQDLGNSLSFYNRHYRIPAIWSYSMTYEVALTQHDILSVSYVGNRVPNSPVSDDVNHVSPQWNAQCDVERSGNRHICDDTSTGQIANPFLGVAPFAGSSYYLSQTISRSAFTRPYSEFGDITENGALSNGKSWYNSLQAVASHQVASSLVLHATYTHAKDETSGNIIDPVNRIFSRQVSGSNDVQHSITFSGVAYLPVGRGRQFFSNVPRLVDAAINGWELSTVYSYYSGFAWRPSDSGGSGGIYDAAGNWEMADGSPINKSLGVRQTILAPDATHKFSRIRGVTPCVGYKDTDTGAIIPSPAALAANCSSIPFVRAPNGYAVGRNNIDFGVRQPGAYRVDATLSKNFALPEASKFRLSEGTNLQIRMDMINAFNHANWDQSFINDPTSPDFGTIQKGPSGPTNLPRYVQLGARFSF